MGGKKKAKKADFQLSDSQKRAAGTFKRDAEQAEKLGLAVKRGLRGMIEEDFSQTLADRTVADIEQSKPGLSYSNVSTGNLLTGSSQQEYAARMKAFEQGQNMKFQNKMGYLDLLTGGQGIGQMGMVNLAELNKQQVLGEGQRKAADYSSRMGVIGKIAGAAGGEYAKHGTNFKDWGDD